MEALIIYTGKIAVCLGLFLAVYTLFLRNTTFLKFKRIYLLFGFLASLLIPLINPTYDVVLIAPISTIESVGSANIVFEKEKSFNIWALLGIVYFTGILFLLIRNICSYAKIGKLIKSGRKILSMDLLLSKTSKFNLHSVFSTIS